MDLSIPRIVFFDTEFSSLGEIAPVELLSVALADIDGREVFYGESDDFDPALCSEFTRANVVPLLWRNDRRLDAHGLAVGFRHAIEALGAPCVVACDSSWDWLWAQALAEESAQAPQFIRVDPRGLAGWPKNLLPRRLHLNFDALPEPAREAARLQGEDALAQAMPHHALTDVRVHAAKARAACQALGLNPRDPASLWMLFGADPGAYQTPLAVR